jgi:hypothetical protein
MGEVSETPQDEIPQAEQKEAGYEALDILQPKDLPRDCGFHPDSWIHNSPHENHEPLFRECLTSVFKDPPEWLLTNRNSSEFEKREANDEPRPQYFTFGDPSMLKRLSKNADTPEGQKEIEKVVDEIASKSRDRLTSPSSARDVVIAAYERMTQEHPNLLCFRGADFNPTSGYSGGDFSVGNLETAMEHYDQSIKGEKREKPVLAMLPLKALVQAYKRHLMGIECEHEWERGTIFMSTGGGSDRISFDHIRSSIRRLGMTPGKVRQRSSKIWRLPDGEAEREAIKEQFRQHTLKKDSSPEPAE